MPKISTCPPIFGPSRDTASAGAQPDVRPEVRVRIVPGCWLHIESIVTQIAEPSRLDMAFCSHWFAGHLTYEIQADTAGSLLRQQETLQPRGPMLWLERIIKPYLQRQFLRRIQDIQQLLPRETAVVPHPAPPIAPAY